MAAKLAATMGTALVGTTPDLGVAGNTHTTGSMYQPVDLEYAPERCRQVSHAPAGSFSISLRPGERDMRCHVGHGQG